MPLLKNNAGLRFKVCKNNSRRRYVKCNLRDMCSVTFQ